MWKRTVIRRLPDGSTEITTVSQGCVVTALSGIFWIWLGAFALVAPAQMGWWSVPLYTIEAAIVLAYVNKRLTEARARKTSG